MQGYQDYSHSIPSELVEGPLTQVIGILMRDALRRGGKKEDWEQLKVELRGVELFVAVCCGVHSVLAMSTFYHGELQKVIDDDELRAHMNASLKP